MLGSSAPTRLLTRFSGVSALVLGGVLIAGSLGEVTLPLFYEAELLELAGWLVDGLWWAEHLVTVFTAVGLGLTWRWTRPQRQVVVALALFWGARAGMALLGELAVQDFSGSAPWWWVALVMFRPVWQVGAGVLAIIGGTGVIRSARPGLRPSV